MDVGGGTRTGRSWMLVMKIMDLCCTLHLVYYFPHSKNNIRDRHFWHSQKLEILLRAADNDCLNLEELENIKEMVDYYLSDYEDPNYFHDEALYDNFENVDK